MMLGFDDFFVVFFWFSLKVSYPQNLILISNIDLKTIYSVLIVFMSNKYVENSVSFGLIMRKR